MHPNRWSIPAVLTAILLLGACAEYHAPPHEVRINSKRVVNGEIALALGESAPLDYHAFDADRNALPVDAICVEWSSGDSFALPILALTPSAAVASKAAWFDTPPDDMAVFAATTDGGMPTSDDAGDEPPAPYLREPEALIVLDVCGTRDTIVAKSVFSVAGTWQITVGKNLVQTVKLEQIGREVSLIPADDVSVPIGEVRGDRLSITMMGYELEGRITSRTEASGTVVGVPADDGAWSAIKHTTITLTP